MRRGLVIGITLLAGCSIVNDPGVHQEGSDGGGMDASTEDAGGTDAGAPDAGMPDAGPGLTPEEYCETYATETCMAYQTCCTMMPPPSYPNCVSDLRTSCNDIFVGLPPALGFDARQALSAADVARGYFAICSTELASWAVGIDGFLSPLIGSLESDAICTPVSADPIQILYAVVSCAEPNEVCRPISASEWRCRPRGSPGEDCTYGFECRSDRCDHRTFAQDTCGAGAVNGTGCQRGRHDQCMSLLCADVRVGLSASSCQPLTQDGLYCQGPSGDGG